MWLQPVNWRPGKEGIRTWPQQGKGTQGRADKFGEQRGKRRAASCAVGRERSGGQREEMWEEERGGGDKQVREEEMRRILQSPESTA